MEESLGFVKYFLSYGKLCQIFFRTCSYLKCHLTRTTPISSLHKQIVLTPRGRVSSSVNSRAVCLSPYRSIFSICQSVCLVARQQLASRSYVGPGEEHVNCKDRGAAWNSVAQMAVAHSEILYFSREGPWCAAVSQKQTPKVVPFFHLIVR